MLHIRTLLVTAALVGVIASLSVPARAQCVNPPFGPNWLQTQEAPNVPAAPGAHGGHTIGMHVNVADQALIDRVIFNHVNADGSYPNVPTAEGAITAALAADAVNINNWRLLANVGNTRRFDYARPHNIGRVAFPIGNPPNAVGLADTCAFAVIMRALPGGACYVLSSFPRPALVGDHCP